jgi:thioesterase domain-containing protein
MSIDIVSVEAYLYEHIPITRAMGLQVTAYDGNAVRLWAPLEPNLNHRQTAFGGSVSTLGILAGWTLLHIRLGQGAEPVQLVIQHSETDYTGPIEQDFTAVCAMPGTDEWGKFEQTFRRYGKARIYLESLIEVGGEVLARHTGAYVAIRLQP